MERNHDLEDVVSRYPGVFFLISGLVRKYCSCENREITVEFIFERELFGSGVLEEHYLGRDRVGLHAIEKTRMVFMPYSLVEKLHGQCPEARILSDMLLKQKLSSLSRQSAISRMPNATERYVMFCSSVKGQRRIPAKFLASYLAMREETLSRIRHRLPDRRFLSGTSEPASCSKNDDAPTGERCPDAAYMPAFPGTPGGRMSSTSSVGECKYPASRRSVDCSGYKSAA